MWVKSMGSGFAAVENPHSNAGQGVHTICSQEELDSFMNEEHHCNGKFVAPTLALSSPWPRTGTGGLLTHQLVVRKLVRNKTMMLDSFRAM
mmetsp:Transcript_46604/g.77446  ORF Transcript_46604/g.77446 Transcript_46604/m.77446 type:complete len:91 (-) Transcript_46604:6-278(-)